MRAAVAALFLIATTAPALAQADGQITQADIDAARRHRAEVARQLADTTARYEGAVADEAVLRDRVESLAASLAYLERQLASLRLEATEIVRGMYMDGGNSQLVGLFDATVFTEIPMRATYRSIAGAKDVETLNRFEASERSYREQQAELQDSLSHQQGLVDDISSMAADIEKALADADAEYQAVVAAWQQQERERIAREQEEARRKAAAEAAARAAAATSTTAATPTTTAPVTTTTVAVATVTTTTVPQPPPSISADGKTCPVDGATTFSDTFGAPRSGGRVHMGVDMIAARGTPIVAIETGSVERLSTSSLGGNSIYFTGASGDKYYYAHLDGYADGIGGGVHVDVGGLLGYNGSTGNAPDWLPHLHFQWAPGGGAWVDPYPLVLELCS